MKKQFKAESKRLLDLMINSIYTNKEIFLRELISNASDAIDKMYYKTLSDNSGFDREKFYIRIQADKNARTLKITDAGIGMNKEELENNLGVIAKSGSLDFKKENDIKEDHSIIGQFGVGFYSAFMVADKVEVLTRAYGQSEAYLWVSEGADGYEIKAAQKAEIGTEITLYLKKDTEDEKYDEFLEEYRLNSLIKKYSDFIRYPIKMMSGVSRKKDGSEEYETVFEDKTLNSMVPVWRKNKSELKEEDYLRFYEEKRFGYDKPARHIHINIEGAVSFRALLYIPKTAPYDYYSKDFQKGLELYSSGVLIMQKCADLLPDHFGFVQGLVDSENLSLNISRELLQQDRQLKFIAKKIADKVKAELLDMLSNDRAAYEEFFKSFGRVIKFGIYNNYGMNKAELEDLLLFTSSLEKKQVTLSEYVSRMKEGQKYIYFAGGKDKDKIDKMPQTEMLKDQGYEILYFTDDVDEFSAQVMHSYKEKEFKNVSSGDLGIEDKKDDAKKEDSENEPDKTAAEAVLKAIKDALLGKVADVRISKRLKSHPVCLTAEGGLSIEMEKVLSTMPGSEAVPKAKKILEINSKHEVFKSLIDYRQDDEKLKLYAELLYGQALLIEGLAPEDPIAFSDAICKLMK